MRFLKSERGFADFLTTIVMAILALFSFTVLGQVKEEKVNEAITDYYNDYEVELVEKGVIGQDDWDRKVVLANGDVKYVDVECNEEESESLVDMKCQVQETQVAYKDTYEDSYKEYKETNRVYTAN